MEGSTLRAALLWSSLQVLNRERYQLLLQEFGSLENITTIDEDVLRKLRCKQKTIDRVLPLLREYDPTKAEQILTQAGADIIMFGDPSYPAALKEIPDAPVFLYFRGDLSVLKQPCVALVGTREMTSYGKRVTQEFARALLQAEIVTVSGLARGVDQLVAEETIKRNMRTVAVLGHGISMLGTRGKALAERIVEHGGLILSEFPMEYPPDLFTYPLRNRIIAGLSMGTVVLEAPVGSGALITARLAFDYSREVFAVPGQIFDDNYAGCHELLRQQKAAVAVSGRDVLLDLGMIAPEPGSSITAYVPQNDEEKKLLGVLNAMPQGMDDLAEKTGLAVSSIGATLTTWELNGIAKNLGQGEWIRV